MERSSTSRLLTNSVCRDFRESQDSCSGELFSRSPRSVCPDFRLASRSWLVLLLTLTAIGLLGEKLVHSAEPTEGATTTELPAIVWDFETDDDASELIGQLEFSNSGPSSLHFLGMPDQNRALELKQAGAHLRIADSAESTALDFKQGEAITLEAWVRISTIRDGANVYIISKGRTYETGRTENHNYALRLVGSGGQAKLSFLFSTALAGS